MSERQKYQSIVEHYEECLSRHGDSHLGVDWPNLEDALTRYRVMVDLLEPDEARSTVSLLDFGCGLSHMYDYIQSRGLSHVEYAGCDISARFVEVSRSKHPSLAYYQGDLLAGTLVLPEFDYVVLNGVFTEKRDLSFEEMLVYFRALLKRVFPHARRGLAFNVMSKHVDWERPDLFHLPFDVVASFLRSELSRHFVIRNDYGLFEYTVYVYREGPARWRK